MTNRDFQPKTLALLFADIVGFGRLTEHQMQFYCSKVLLDLSDQLGRRPPLQLNTWGDAIFAMYEDAMTAVDRRLVGS